MKFLCLLVVLSVLALPVAAIPIESVHYFNQPTGLPISFGWDVVQTLTREALILDALAEWDLVVCTERFFLFDYLTGTIKIKWEDRGADGPLAVTSANSIVINSAYAWYEGFGTPGADQYDLLSVLKHEIGHAAGVIGDWGRLAPGGVGEDYTDANGNGHYDPGENYYDTNGNGRYDVDYTPPSYAHSNQLMWGYFDKAQTIRNVAYCDAQELEPAYTVHPEPGTILLAFTGVGVLVLFRRRFAPDPVHRSMRRP